jgi:hypothetical protein
MSPNLNHRLQILSQRENRDSHLLLEEIKGSLTSSSQTRANSRNDVVKEATGISAAQDMPAYTSHSLSKGEGNPPQIVSTLATQLQSEKQQCSRIRHESPWKMYTRGYELKLDQFITVAIRKAPQAGKVAIKEIATKDINLKLQMLRTIRHDKFVALLEIFKFDERCYAVFEHIFVTIAQVAACPAYPTEPQLAAILGQVSLNPELALHAHTHMGLDC